ncbi:sugar phosphate nucleotidyltransferase [Alicyclobacillus herbarius]|uniref:sugar phosphate nucleotidyltransferase n=1 Tax=Alicyclobacillus herbarius TaxID=122960 RepID=UPI00047B29E0|nr:sugar phosphate nucleotidyltransferase [Alicyclobacillus herbarius]
MQNTFAGGGIIPRSACAPQNFIINEDEIQVFEHGVYLYDERVFDYIDSLTPSGRGEYEITDVNRAYLEDGLLDYRVWPDLWLDAGTFSALALANEWFFNMEYPVIIDKENPVYSRWTDWTTENR